MKQAEPIRTVEEMVHLIKSHNITSYKVSQGAGVAVNSVERILTKTTNKPRKETLAKIDQFLLKLFPLTSKEHYGVLDNVPKDVIMSYIYDNREAFEESTSFRLFIDTIISNFKSEFFQEQNNLLTKVLEGLTGSGD